MFRQTWFHAWAALLLIAATTSAQQTTDGQNVPIASVGVSTWFSVVNIPAIPDVPFSATTMMDNTQTLADGTTVTTKTMTLIARDSKGRTHNENRYIISGRPTTARGVSVTSRFLIQPHASKRR